MKVVIDTNVLVSAILRDRDPEKLILLVLERPDIEWVTSPAIIEEVESVLRRPKFAFPEDLWLTWVGLLRTRTTILEVAEVVASLRDPADQKFLACAIAAGADYLITGDRDFTPASVAGQTEIVSVAQFLGLMGGGHGS